MRMINETEVIRRTRISGRKIARQRVVEQPSQAKRRRGLGAEGKGGERDAKGK